MKRSFSPNGGYHRVNPVDPRSAHICALPWRPSPWSRRTSWARWSPWRRPNRRSLAQWTCRSEPCRRPRGGRPAIGSAPKWWRTESRSCPGRSWPWTPIRPSGDSAESSRLWTSRRRCSCCRCRRKWLCRRLESRNRAQFGENWILCTRIFSESKNFN